MNIKIKSMCFFVLLMVAVSGTQPLTRGGQGERRGKSPFGQELFAYNVYKMVDPSDQTKIAVDLSFSFVNDILTFFKSSDSLYRAAYDLQVILYRDDDTPLLDRMVSKSVHAHSFAETNSRTKVIRERITLSIDPGDYMVRMSLFDEESERKLQREQPLRLQKPGPLMMSDIIFVDSIDCSGAIDDQFLANIRGVFQTKSSLPKAFVDIRHAENSDSGTIRYVVSDENKKRIETQIIDLKNPPELQRVCLDLSGVDQPGRYTLKVQLKVDKRFVTKESEFHINWGELVFQEGNLDLAIEQLSMIAGGDAIDPIHNAETLEQKRLLFEEFWKERDPTPGTEPNELKNEFFRRIDFSNRNFSVMAPMIAGWKTDRGNVYIKNGPPTQVERQPTEINMPAAEIWFYANLNKRYIFSDRNGTGNYRLVKVE
jgi:GWxTD domain-containing protein